MGMCLTDYGMASGQGHRYWGFTRRLKEDIHIIWDILNLHKQEVTHE